MGDAACHVQPNTLETNYPTQNFEFDYEVIRNLTDGLDSSQYGELVNSNGYMQSVESIFQQSFRDMGDWTWASQLPNQMNSL